MAETRPEGDLRGSGWMTAGPGEQLVLRIHSMPAAFMGQISTTEWILYLSPQHLSPPFWCQTPKMSLEGQPFPFLIHILVFWI